MSIVGITMGCPASIGPELILKYFSQEPCNTDITPVVLGDSAVLEYCAQSLELHDIKIEPWDVGEKLHQRISKVIPVLNLSQLKREDITWGTPNIATAKAMARYITEGTKMAQSGALDAITTCPISKFALNQAGYAFPGHTEMLAELTGSSGYAMMMAGDRLKVTLVTIHCSLADVPSILTKEAISQMIATTHHALTVDLGIDKPRIAVAALNPHGGENQLFGSEEETVIVPSIAEALKNGIAVSGPYPPDIIFFKAAQGDFDAVVCMYHDQGLIPFKLLHFDDGVNVTLGLPIVRTSVDHGTGYDIAGKGIAKASSLTEAVKLADIISVNRKTSVQRLRNRK